MGGDILFYFNFKISSIDSGQHSISLAKNWAIFSIVAISDTFKSIKFIMTYKALKSFSSTNY